MANFINSTQWTNNITLTKQSGTILTIATKNKFVDRDIKITLGSCEASDFKLDVSTVSGDSAVTVGTLSGENYPITVNNLSITATLTATTAGWFSTGSATDLDIDSVTVGTMPAAIISGSCNSATATTTVEPGAVTISNAATDISGKQKVIIAPVTATTGINTYYIPLKASAAANTIGTTSSISGSGTAIVTKAGYAPESLTGTILVSGTATAKTSKIDSSDYYIPLPKASGAWQEGTTVDAKATPGITNTNSINTITSPTGTAGTDYWTLTPIITSSTAGSYKAEYAYKSNGQGWVPNSATLTDGTARSVSVSAQEGTAIYIPKAVYSTDAGKTTITTAGYLPKNTVVTNIATVTPKFDGGGLTVSSSIDGSSVTLGTSNTSGISVSSTGSASRAAVLYNGAVNGYINIEDNAIALAGTTNNVTQASATTRYITAVTLPKDKKLSVTTAADTALDTTSDLTITNNKYRRVNITNAVNGTVLIANSGKSTVTSGSATAGNLSVNAYDNAATPALSGAQTVVSNGKWVTTAVEESGTYYGKVTVGAAELGSEGSVTTAPSVAVTNSTTMVTTTTNTGYSFTVGGTASNGTVQTKYKATTAGYTPVVSAIDGETVSVTPNVTGGTTVYIKKAIGSVVMSKGDGSCILQDSSNVTTSNTNTSGVSVTFRGSGTVSATAKITTAGYTPTNNSFATGDSTSSDTADLTKYITGVTLTKGKTFSITVPNGPLNSNGTNNNTITFVFTVANDNTGNVTVTGPD